MPVGGSTRHHAGSRAVCVIFLTSLFARLKFGRAKPIVKFLQRYEDVRKQIDKISNDLDSHKTRLLTDITSLDRLYEANLNYFHDLELYIAAGDEKLKQLAQPGIGQPDQS